MDVMTENETPTSARKSTERTCVGCGKKGPPSEMVRLVLGPEGEIAADLAGGAFGRGAHVHPSEPCLAKAVRGGLSKTFRQKVECALPELALAIAVGAKTRARGLLLGASRARLLVAGADLAEGALEASPKAVLVVAADAARPTGRPRFHQAVADGRAVVLGTKRELGSVLGQEEVAFCTVTDEKVARELARLACALGAVTPILGQGAPLPPSTEADTAQHEGARSEVCRSPEGR